MRKQQRLLAALLLACLVTLPRLSAQDAPAAAKKALLWKATSGNNSLYLLGSIHVGSTDMYPLPKEIEGAFAAAKTLIVEVDLNKLDMQKMTALMLSKGMYPGDDTLWAHVSPEIRAKVESFCDKYQLPSAALSKMKPWVVAITAATLPMLKAGMDPNLGIDKYFLDKAAQADTKKNVVEIESAEWQLNLLSSFSDDIQAKFLDSSIDQANKSIEHGKEIQAIWLSGDADRLAAALKEDSGPPEITKVLLTDRNPHMADVAEQYLKAKDQAFLVVGAAHLVGKDGVIADLQKRGYKLQQVTLAK
ncbi:MAG TPA: TraB/GumN family protein [Candidatus Sulfopaludibacter sp.]|jgi:hypothetical protein|nr:TraB/GumN family protein [Candidatus Sulfopaludibacter sp.]